MLSAGRGENAGLVGDLGHETAGNSRPLCELYLPSRHLTWRKMRFIMENIYLEQNRIRWSRIFMTGDAAKVATFGSLKRFTRGVTDGGSYSDAACTGSE